MKTRKLSFFTYIVLIVLVAISGCQKKDYYTDTGRHDGTFNGSVLDYLKSRHDYFDSVVKIIHIAGMDDVFDKEDITFFAPADSTINSTLGVTNMYLWAFGMKEVTRLEQIKPEVWRMFLTRYLFKGKKAMNDYPQIDPENLSAFPGRIYNSYDGQIMNIGVIYNDAVSGKGNEQAIVKYAGYRQLTISFIPSISAPLDYRSWYPAMVASVNIAPRNGYVHVLSYADLYVPHNFGFSSINFAASAINAGIGD